jgi:phosphopantothenoylcysteine decarboxylase/phosphopantothenate--cysteine ligase
MNVVVTSGATREPIDSVRFISNVSSGRTGAAICEALSAHGFSVIQLHGVDSAIGQRVLRREQFTDHASLDAGLKRLLRDSSIGAVIHSAAVGDFALAEPPAAGKIESGRELSIQLRPTPKIIDRIHGYSGNNHLLLIGFKLTHEPDAESQARAARELMKRSHARYVVQNDVATLASDQHAFVIHESGSSRVRRYVGRIKLASAIVGLLEEHAMKNRR